MSQSNIVDQIPWLYETDLRIFWLLEQQDLKMKPGHIHRNVFKDNGELFGIHWIRERVYALEEYGLLKVVDSDARFYGLTDLGKRVARGDVSAEELAELADFPEEEETEADEEVSEEDWLGERRRELLLAFSGAQDDQDSQFPMLDTPELRERTDVPDGSILYHLDELANQGFLDNVEDERENPRGPKARVWRLAEKGKAFIDNLEGKNQP